MGWLNVLPTVSTPAALFILLFIQQILCRVLCQFNGDTEPIATDLDPRLISLTFLGVGRMEETKQLITQLTN